MINDEPKFLSPLIVKNVENKWWRFDSWLGYYSVLDNSTTWIPPGFIYDGVSRPIFTRPTAPGGVHDFHFRWGFVPQFRADRMFLEAMKVDHHSWSNQRLIRRTLRFFNRGIKFVTVATLGVFAYKEWHGVLDPRMCKKCQWGYSYDKRCFDCSNFFDEWNRCYKKGFWPDPPIKL